MNSEKKQSPAARLFSDPLRRTTKFRSHDSSNCGAALVLVLSLLAIITFLVLAIALRSTAERRASASVEVALSTELLAGIVENLSQSQIRVATSQPSDVAWASQPGMIRSFDSTGALKGAYKLYTGISQMIPSQSALDSELVAESAALDTFQSKPAIFVDLNRPAIFRSEVAYPIADPRALGKVDGFTYSGTTTADTQSFQVNAVATNLPVIPMPVQWAYVLRNGEIVLPLRESGDGRRIPIHGATAASGTNPIVGRIAYWTDDDSSKLNVNTAADGTYWDTPRTGSSFAATNVRNWEDYRYSIFQPAQFEYQRYPGHPATTSLRPVLAGYPNFSAATDSALREKLIALSPRYQSGGSLGGTVTPTAPLVLKTQPLLSSADELYFLSNSTAATDRGPQPDLTADVLEQTRFFLTANSRAPEVNLFNMPKVSIWPVSSQSGINSRTVNDSLNLFCSTLGVGASAQVFAFTRNDPRVVSGELTNRNLQIYNYLDALMKKPVPGFGVRTFLNKYPQDQQQILTGIYDFIRSTNIVDQSSPSASFSPFTTKPTLVGGTQVVATPGSGQVVPTVVTSSGNKTQGFGRFATVSEAALWIIGERQEPSPGNFIYNARAVFLTELASVAQGNAAFNPDFQMVVTGLDGLEVDVGNGTFSPLGFPASATNILDTGNRAGLSFHDTRGGTVGIGATLLYPTSGLNSLPRTPDNTSTGDRSRYPFVSNPFAPASNIITSATDPNQTALTALSGTSFAVTQTKPIVVSIQTTAGQEVQKINLEFPQFRPNYPKPLDAYNVQGAGTLMNMDTLAKRFGVPDAWPQYFMEYMPHVNDVVKSLIPMGNVNGDTRLVAALPDVPVAVFQPHGGYAVTTGNTGIHHTLNYGFGPYGRFSGRFGRLVAGASYPISGGARLPLAGDLPPSINGVRNSLGRPGDFDTGIGDAPDGAWINKPDEGDTLNIADAASNDRTPYFGSGVTMVTGQSLFSPNRQIASPVQFGSLPTGVKSGQAWQTLLFSPNPAACTANADKGNAAAHKGFGAPHDGLLLDLFWMPVAEPYAISDPLSTAGKVNLNHKLIPFQKIGRTTALRGVLQNTKITAIPFDHAPYYKTTIGTDIANANNYRYPIDVDKTLIEIDNRLSVRGCYLSPAEICEVFLIPQQSTGNPTATTGLSGANILSTFWQTNRLTGDNLRERPYAVLYPKLTTKSNVFTVHYTVQALKQAPNGQVGFWDEDKDIVLGEARGAITLERYIDPRDPDFSTSTYDFTAQVNAATPPTLGRFYKFRTLANRPFRH